MNLHEQARAAISRLHEALVQLMDEDEAATRTRVATGPSMDIVTHGVLGDWGKTHAVVDALIDAGYGSKPHTRVVTTVDELHALPIGSVVRAKPLVYLKDSTQGWVGVRGIRVTSVTLSAFAPLVLLFDPEDDV